MRTKFIIHIINLCITCMLFAACADQNDKEEQETLTDTYLVQLDLGTRILPDNLECDLYIFRKGTSGTDYTLSEIIPFGSEEGKYLRFLNTDLLSHNYRFFFIAKDPGNTEVGLQNNASASLAIGEQWRNVRITSNSLSLSDDLYYKVLDKSGASILNDGAIHATLGRMVGQITLDIFRIDGSIDNPIPKQSADVESVIDRVFQIDLQYTGLTKIIAFDDNGNIVEVDQWQDAYLQTILPVVGTGQKVSIPQEDMGLLISGQDTQGSVRIMGVCGLPATEKIRIVATFHYYDTTPIPGSSGTGDDASDSFMTKELTLNIPQKNTSEGLLGIVSDYFTVNLAGIRYDRIIDIGVNGSYSFNTTWDVYE